MKIRYLLTLLLFFPAIILMSQESNDTIQRVKAWQLSADFTRTDTTVVDTAFSMYHRFRVSDELTPFNAYTGNYGLPFYRLDFFRRSNDPDNYLKQYYLPFIFNGRNTNFINTTTPFTELRFSYAGPSSNAEQTFRVTHTQNVNKDLNVGLLYDIIFSSGHYPYQRTSDKRFNLWGSYSKSKYEAYLSFSINNLLIKENGGITDSQQLSELDPQDVQVNLGGLNAAGTSLLNRNFMAVQKLTIGGPSATADSTASERKNGGLSGTLLHALTFDVTKRNYADNNPGGGYYDSVYISNTATNDSLSERIISNTLRFDVKAGEGKNFSLGFGGGIRNDIILLGQIVPRPDTLSSDTISRVRVSNVLVGTIYNNIGAGFGWRANGELWVTGYRAGDIRISGNITKRLGKGSNALSLNVNGGFEALSPSWWFSNWGSNHYQWSVTSDKEYRISTGVVLKDRKNDFLVEGRYAIIDNYAYFDTLGLPVQQGGGLSVLSATLKKNLALWKLHLDSEVLLQQSSNPDVLPLPTVAVNSAFYFQHNFQFKSTGGNLNTQLGVEALYHTRYRGSAYMPATGVFHNQISTEVGNYPFINLFLNVKLKRTRFLVMLDHVNAGFTGYDYMMVPNYPMNVRMFRYGLSWTFYD